MRVMVNGVRLYFDVEGAGLVPAGAVMRQKTTLLLLHGGPGFDHSIFKPLFAQLADIAQIVYLDLRGNGRSDPGPRELWTLAQWGDDVAGFCAALDIERPIVLGTSFGGFVATAYATRHPGHPGKLVLISSEAKGDSDLERRVALFERFGGPEVGALARRRFLERQSGPEIAEAWLRLAFPHYTRRPRDPALGARTVRRPEVSQWFFAQPDGEAHRFDFRDGLGRVQCPTLVMGGEDDPMHPIESQQEIARLLPQHLVRFERFADAGHAVVPDQPQRAMAVLREFIAG